MNERLLLDTNVLIWTVSEDDQISTRARRVIASSTSALFVSVVSVWELALKHQAGKLHFEGLLEEVLDQILYRSPWTILPMSAEHLLPLATLPMLHKDPFDRLLIAQARHEGMAIVTADETIAKYDVRTIW